MVMAKIKLLSRVWESFVKKASERL